MFVNLDAVTYWSLLGQVDAMVGNSSSGIMEAASFGLPVVNVGMRQQGRERGRNIIDVVADTSAISTAIEKALQPLFRESLRGMENPYGNGTAAQTIARVLTTVPLERPSGEGARAGRGGTRPGRFSGTPMSFRFPLSSPDITEAEIAAVTAVLRTPRLSMGPELEAFEKELARYHAVEDAVVVSSGTAALHLALITLGVGPGHEVILPSFAFLAVANVVHHVGADSGVCGN